MSEPVLPRYYEFIYPTIRAVAALGGSANGREILSKVLEDLAPSEQLLAITYDNRPDDSKYIERLHWARSYAKLIGALESPTRGVFLLTALGKELLAMPPQEAERRIYEMDREYRRSRPERPTTKAEESVEEDSQEEVWKAELLSRLHRLSPDGFEEFVLYLLRLYGLQLERVGGTGDEGIDGIGLAPLSPVLSSRVAVQVKRYDPEGRAIGRETVALFQRDAQTKGAERAILVTLGRFSPAATKAALAAAPTVDLIDGDRLAELVLEQEAGVRPVPTVDLDWFDKFDK